MYEHDADDRSFEEMAREIAREVGESFQRAASEVDLDEVAGMVGVDPDTAREWAQTAGGWLRARVEKLGDEVAHRAPEAHRAGEHGAAAAKDPLDSAGPHPLDLPTEEQGLALAALDSGRWTVEPGSDMMTPRGEGPRPSGALGLVRELRVRDWIAADGELTVAGRHALGRWVEAAR
jgi:hypothetical protein